MTSFFCEPGSGPACDGNVLSGMIFIGFIAMVFAAMIKHMERDE